MTARDFSAKAPRGGSFLWQQTSPPSIFSPERFSGEHLMLRSLAKNFLESEVLPREEAMERHEWDTTVRLLRHCGELGLLGLEVPHEFGGEGLDNVSAMIVAEEFARSASFGVSYGGQAGIGTLPLVYFGTEAQKRQYLPSICKGELLTAYALSEASSGSDALAAKTSATRSDGGWILRGEKMWITNAAFAGLFITFAKVDGREFTCFLVEKGFPGVSTGAEERKMGLKGSSTRPLLLDNAQVPAGNVLGEIGKGHHVAFNILNLGRAKLGAISVGAGKAALNEAIRYAGERVAFGRPIAQFGAIQHKIAEMAVRIWVTESMVYRTAGLLDSSLAAADAHNAGEMLAAIRDCALECSILKVYGSEVLDFVVDEALQIHGGYGYSAEYAVERYYRDARVNRIFEGTNEINRMLIANTALKRDLDRQDADRTGILPHEFAAESAVLDGARAVFRRAASVARKQLGDTLKDEQEVLLHLSDIIMEIYAIDSSLARACAHPSDTAGCVVRTYVNDATARILNSATSLLAFLLSGSSLATELTALLRLMEWTPLDTVRLRRRLATQLSTTGRLP
jgi:alkylation response protein AidB-like acyl-CoA dehydrogenase